MNKLSNLEKRRQEKILRNLISQSIIELSPYWFGAKPQFTSIKVKNTTKFVLLDPTFFEHTWLIFFLDCTSYLGIQTIHLIEVWIKRYKYFTFKVLLIFKSHYEFLQSRWEDRYLVNYDSSNFITCLDKNNYCAEVFGISSHQSQVLLLKKNGVKHFEKTICFENTSWESGWAYQTEQELQNFFRSLDPGLATVPLYYPLKPWPKASFRFECGSLLSDPHIILLQGSFVDQALNLTQKESIYFIGEWLQDEKKITTQDSQASLTFFLSARGFCMIAEAYSKTADTIFSNIYYESEPIPLDITGPHIQHDEFGQSICKIHRPQVYFLIEGLDKPGWIRFSFQNIKNASISIYALEVFQ